MSRIAVLFVAITIFQVKNGIAEDSEYYDIKELLKIGGDVEIKEVTKLRTAKNLDYTFEDGLENFFKSNEVSMKIPFGSTVTFSGRGLDDGELDFKLNLNSGSDVQARKKSKIKRIIAPILVVLLLKAITLIPLALGVLGIKTWNALQLAFFSFVTSVVLAVWKICSKFSDHHHPPHIIHEAIHDVHIPHVYHDSHHNHHGGHHSHYHDESYHDDDHHQHLHHDPWNHHYHRSDVNAAQHMAYNEYVPETNIKI